MEMTVLKMLFVACVSAQVEKHVYVPHTASWTSARRYCRKYYTDLSPITTSEDEELLRNSTIGIVKTHFWIGLYKDGSTWKWSGGGNAENIVWAESEKSSTESELYGAVCWHSCGDYFGWHQSPSMKLVFFCIRLIVVEERKSWEEALEHCRNTHTELTSMKSETEVLLALKEIRRDDVSFRVWIGLRYLAGSWLWVNGDRLAYESWAKVEEPENLQCPVWGRFCGALTQKGEWNNWDCQRKLSFICY